MTGPLQAYASIIQNLTGLDPMVALLIIGMTPLTILAAQEIDLKKNKKQILKIGLPSAFLLFNLLVIMATQISNPVELATRNIVMSIFFATATGLFVLATGRDPT